jgi:cold-inducible RNA-binding protein
VPLVQNESAQEDPTKTKLYVGNISFETTVEELEVQFSQFGKLHDCYIPRFPEGNSRGFAFVTLDSEVADAAMEATNGMELNGRSVAVSKSLSPNEKKQQSPSNKRGKYSRYIPTYILILFISTFCLTSLFFAVFLTLIILSELRQVD